MLHLFSVPGPEELCNKQKYLGWKVDASVVSAHGGPDSLSAWPSSQDAWGRDDLRGLRAGD